LLGSENEVIVPAFSLSKLINNRRPSNNSSFLNGFEGKIFVFSSNTGTLRTFLAKTLGFLEKIVSKKYHTFVAPIRCKKWPIFAPQKAQLK
jgi:hypothetical protein